MLEHFWRVPVDFQPGHRLFERPAVHQRAAGARGEMQVHEAALQAEHLAQAFDVAARQRQDAEREPRLFSELAIGDRRWR